jgi:hypothetical protein
MASSCSAFVWTFWLLAQTPAAAPDSAPPSGDFRDAHREDRTDPPGPTRDVSNRSAAAIWTPTRESGWALAVEGGTQFPLLVGGRLELELPGRVRIGGELGMAPDAYFDLIEEVATVAGVDPAEAATVRRAADEAWSARALVSWAPFGRSFYLAGGYSYTEFSGSMTGDQLLDELSMDFADPFRASATLQSQMHGVLGELGFRFFVDRFTVRVSAGVSATLAAESQVTTRSDSETADEAFESEIARWSRQAESEMEGWLEQYGIVPSVGLGIGYRLPL